MAMMAGLSHWQAESDGTPLRDITLGALLAETAGRFGDRPAIVFDETDAHLKVNWSYSELDARVNDLARGLMAIGIERNDRVAILSPNRPEWILLEYALARIGAVLVTVNPSYRQAELAYLLSQGRVSTLFAVGAYRGFSIAAMIGDMLPELAAAVEGRLEGRAEFPDLRRVVAIGSDGIPGAMAFADIAARADATGAAELAGRSMEVSPDAIAQVQYTSGTTGKPKGAMLTHRGIVNNAILAGRRAGYSERDVMVSAMPFFHTAGCVCNVIGMAAVGGCLVAMESFDAAKMLDLIETYRGTITNAVPTMYVRIVQDAAAGGGRNLSSWRMAYTGGTSIPPSLMLDLNTRFGVEPAIIMGMTECSPIITQSVPTDPLEDRVTNAGIPLPHAEIRIADVETGETVPQGKPGELLIRGYLITAGYFDMPERTAEAIDPDGWLHSGDLALLEAGGYLRIVGRIKDMLIRGGENIYPAEIEDSLTTHELIAEAQVVGVPDPEFGEEIFAFIVPRDGAEVSPDALRQWCRKTMARHKLPRYLALIKSMPMTANGKVRKVDLREMARKMIEEGQVQ